MEYKKHEYVDNEGNYTGPLTVQRYLYLYDTKIKALPDNLIVQGDLYLCRTKIKTLPDNLTVGGHLYLSNTNIEPAFVDGRGYKLRITKNYIVAGCITFRSKEEAIAHWGSSDYPDEARGQQFVGAIERNT